MDDSFRVRVEKVFGSLASRHEGTPPLSFSSSASASLSSLWCLTDDEIERNGANRDPEGSGLHNMPANGPYRSNGFLEHLTDLDELVDGDGDGDEGSDREEVEKRLASRSDKPDDFNEEEWEIKSSIGMDCTLDFEEEDDAYDKFAVGNENSSDHLFMKDVNDYETEANDWNTLSGSIRDVNSDPGANLIATKMRLKEDSEAANQMSSLRVSEKIDSCEDGSPKSILKGDDYQINAGPQKRVRFSSECRDDFGERSIGDGNGSDEEHKLQLDYPSGIPDYMRNPSRYTRYTFDSTEMDDESNRQACIDLFNMLRGRKNNMEEDAPIELPKSIQFIPKITSGDATMAGNLIKPAKNRIKASKESLHRRGINVGTAAVDGTADAVCPMEEDEEEASTGTKRGSAGSGRRYRTKAKSEMDE